MTHELDEYGLIISAANYEECRAIVEQESPNKTKHEKILNQSL